MAPFSQSLCKNYLPISLSIVSILATILTARSFVPLWFFRTFFYGNWLFSLPTFTESNCAIQKLVCRTYSCPERLLFKQQDTTVRLLFHYKSDAPLQLDFWAHQYSPTMMQQSTSGMSAWFVHTYEVNISITAKPTVPLNHVYIKGYI